MSLCVVCAAEIRDDARFCPACGAEQPKQAEASDDQDPFIGQIVAKNFRIEKLLGVGGMGKVYKARQLSLDKDVVIKILHDHFRDDPQLVQRFQREARAASRLNHPNSIQVIDFGQDDNGVLFMAIEFLDGRDLFGILKDDGPIAPERLAKMMLQVCSALAEAHAQNVIHRDLKPENIMIVDHRGTEHVKVLDFGIAKIQDPDETPGQALTQAGMVCGTPEYMSPEQARGLKLDHRSDLYALGVVCYQLATGELPFTADSPIGIVTKHILEEPEAPAARFPQLNIPAALEHLILKSMAKDADARFATASDMGAAFDAMLRDPQPAPVASPVAAPVGGTMVGVAAAHPTSQPSGAHPNTGGHATSGGHAAPHPTSGAQPAPTNPPQPQAPEPPAVVVKTISVDDSGPHGTPTRPTPTAQKFDALAVNDDDGAPAGGGAAKWVALAAIFLLVVAGGVVFAFKDVLFPPGDIVVAAPATNAPEAEPVPKTAEPPAPESKPEPPPPEPEAAVNGTKTNGTKTNGTKTNGTKTNVTKTNGTKTNGTKTNGTKTNGTKTNEASTAVVKTNGTKTNGTKTKQPRDRNPAESKKLYKQANAAFGTDVEKAYKLAKRAIQADPLNFGPLKLIAFYHKTKGNNDKSCAAIRQYIVSMKLKKSEYKAIEKRYCVN